MTPDRPSAEMTAILELGGSQGLPDHDRVEDRRVTAEAALFGPLAAGTKAQDAPLGGRPALWIRPDELNTTDGPILLYMHGGAFEVCSPRGSGLLLELGLAPPYHRRRARVPSRARASVSGRN